MNGHCSGFLFGEDQDKERQRLEFDRRSRIYGTPEFHIAYQQHLKTPEWRNLCRLVKERARNRCERCGPHVISVGKCAVHHLTYERFMRELLTDLQLLCSHHHQIADREREARAREHYEEAGEEAREAAGMNTFFTKILGDHWHELFADDPDGFYDEWESFKQRKDEEEGYY
jgi:hypothetical protein